MTQQEILNHLGIDALNAMQEETIAAYRRSRQLVLLSPTGSGKTLAYLLPLVEELQRNLASANNAAAATSFSLALVLVPSRELASQTVDVVKAMKCGLQAVACYGGRPAMEEHRVLRELKPHIIVATPGRAADHLRKQNFDGSAVQTLVIDEFDKSLELGFRDEMAEVIGLLPNLRRRFLLSATDSEQIPSFVGAGFSKLDFTEPDAADADGEGKLTLHLVRSPEKDKLQTLRGLLCHIGAEPSMVFVNYRESVERVASFLQREGFSVSAFHGGMEQRDRERALYRFAGGSALTLVSTDLAARGLDIDDVRHIIHYHLPLNEDAFTHRNGRTARWDRAGDAWVILGPDEDISHLITASSAIAPAAIASAAIAPSPKSCAAVPFLFRPVCGGTSAAAAPSAAAAAPSAAAAAPSAAAAPPSPAAAVSSSASSPSSPPQPRWTTLYIGKGKKDKVNKVDIVGFLSKVGGLQREELGRIDVGDHWAYAAVARERVEEVLLRVRAQKIKGMKTIIEKAK